MNRELESFITTLAPAGHSASRIAKLARAHGFKCSHKDVIRVRDHLEIRRGSDRPVDPAAFPLEQMVGTLARKFGGNNVTLVTDQGAVIKLPDLKTAGALRITQIALTLPNGDMVGWDGDWEHRPG